MSRSMPEKKQPPDLNAGGCSRSKAWGKACTTLANDRYVLQQDATRQAKPESPYPTGYTTARLHLDPQRPRCFVLAKDSQRLTAFKYADCLRTEAGRFVYAKTSRQDRCRDIRSPFGFGWRLDCNKAQQQSTDDEPENYSAFHEIFPSHENIRPGITDCIQVKSAM